MSDRSPCYSYNENRKSWRESRDALETVFGRLWLRLPRTPQPPDPPANEALMERRRAVLVEALEVLSSVAAADSDSARKLNGVGFSKGDTTLGHRLAAATVDQAMDDPALAGKIVRMALRYRLQAFELAQHDLF